jgi:cell division protein FtsB
MIAEREPRHLSAGRAVFAISMIALMSYLTFAALQGEYGLFRLFQIEAQEARLRAELATLRAERIEVANKTRRLSADYLDVELLDEQARKVLGLGRPDEIMIR